MRILFFLHLTVVAIATANAQMFEDSRVSQLETEGIAVAFSICDLVFVIRNSEMQPKENPQLKLSELLPAAKAVRQGFPKIPIRELINQELKARHKLHLATVSAENLGDSGFVWKITWKLFPALGGLGGQPFEFIAYVLPDGTAATPEIYLCDQFIGNPFEEEKAIFSSISIAKLTDSSHLRLPKLEAQEIATKELKETIDRKNLRISPRIHSVSRCIYPATLHSQHAKNEKIGAWAVKYVLENEEVSKDLIDIFKTGSHTPDQCRSDFTVWVTDDRIVSQITMGTWTPNP